MTRTLLLLIRAYQIAVSPLLGRHCRFDPTCSRYAMQAVETHGAIKGGWLALRRVARCHPMHRGAAHDPVPPPRQVCPRPPDPL